MKEHTTEKERQDRQWKEEREKRMRELEEYMKKLHDKQ